MNVTRVSRTLATPDKRMSKSESHCTGPYDMVDVHSNGTVTIEMDTCINASTFKEYRNTK